MVGRRSQSILVVAAHPADEVLGCGGTIARHAEQGDAVQVLIVADSPLERRKSPQTKFSKPYVVTDHRLRHHSTREYTDDPQEWIAATILRRHDHSTFSANV